ncbi:MAG: 50S ribosomal protein L21 [Holosporaceae bacterium]|jgi:large subunit ribosomal protein L21|nr:50S ribosomal protein L21 [Holosporaceae bacterium]
MFAVIKTGGQQYKVKEGDFVSVEKLSHEVGENIEVSDVLLIEHNGDVKVGTPIIPGALVIANVVAQKRHKTILVFKKSRRKNYRRKNGHRQPATILRIESIRQ